MRGKYYLFENMNHELELYTEGDHVHIPMKLMDEFVVMRYAQMTKKQKEFATKRAIKNWEGNIGCDSLLAENGLETTLSRLKREAQKKP